MCEDHINEWLQNDLSMYHQNPQHRPIDSGCAYIPRDLQQVAFKVRGVHTYPMSCNRELSKSGLCFHTQKPATDSSLQSSGCIDRYLVHVECIDSYLLYPLQQIHIECFGCGCNRDRSKFGVRNVHAQKPSANTVLFQISVRWAMYIPSKQRRSPRHRRRHG